MNAFSHRIAGLVLCSLCTTALSAQQVVFPDSPLGRAGHALIDALAGADTSAIPAFVRQFVSTDAMKEIPAADRIAWLRLVREQGGGFAVRSAEDVGGVLEIVCTTQVGGRWIRFFAFNDELEPGHLREYGVVVIRDPAVEAADAWPTTRMSEEEIAAEIGRRMQAAAGRDEFSGVVLVARGDRIIFHEACGLADRNWNAPNSTATRFHLASMGKMFTAVTIAQLVEEGRLSFSDTLANVLPGYPDRAAARKITIDHLLSHRAGLGMLFDRPGYDRRKRHHSCSELLPYFAHEPLLFDPGTRSAYSNEGYVVLGAVIEQLTGLSYDDRVRQRILEPAGMQGTAYIALDDVAHDLAVGYTRFEDDPLAMGPRKPNWIFLGWKGGPEGGAYSNAEDMFRFTQALRSGKLVSPPLLDTLLSSHTKSGWYGYGFMIGEAGGKALRGHGGGGPHSGISSALDWFVDGSYTAIVLSSYDMPGAGEFQARLLEFLARQ